MSLQYDTREPCLHAYEKCSECPVLCELNDKFCILEYPIAEIEHPRYEEYEEAIR